MNDFSISVTDWFGAPDSESNASFGALRIDVDGRPCTEVHDAIARTTRPAIHVPTNLVAEWLLTRWWRLRWEPRPEAPGYDWMTAHSMAAIGGGHAWPPLEISGDGEFVQLSLRREDRPDVAGIRYLNDVSVDVEGADFDAAVDAFCATVEDRIALEPALTNNIRELARELRDERRDPDLARRCRWEARAGFDPGDPLDDWIEALKRLASQHGDTGMEDLLAKSADYEKLARAIDAVKQARVSVDLSAVPAAPKRRRGQRPWERGSQAAQAARKKLNLLQGPISNETLAEILGTRLPLDADPMAAPGIGGGYRADDGSSSTRVLVTSGRATSQRFYLCRLIGMASAIPAQDPLLPITDTHTALQKLGRSFGQEFLCPWNELEAFVAEDGTSEESIVRAAERYQVSELLIASTLVNHGKIDRARLERFS